jgi:DNA-binding response OmpR family regulator
MPRRDRAIVLIVSEDQRVIEAGKALPADRFVVTFVATAQEALAEAMNNRPEVAVLELHVGDFGGFALAKELRDLPEMTPFALIMLCDRPHDRWLCRQAGAAAVIVKPVADPTELLSALDSVLLPTG